VLQRYFDGYHFVPPYRSTFWCRLAKWILPYQLRHPLGVTRWQFQGMDRLRESLQEGAGILLTPNHCRLSDPALMGQVGVEVGRFFHFIASYHLFKQSRFWGWYLNRTGAFSINREGIDREGIRASVRILAEGKRPLVLFPEGTWFRQNDRLGRLQEGTALIARHAQKTAERPIRIHPVGITYWVLEDPRPVLRERLARLERPLGWHAQDDLELIPRIEKLGTALLAVKEVEFLEQVQEGSLDERIVRLLDARVAAVEKYHFGKTHHGWALERIRRLRRHLVRSLADAGQHSAEASLIRRHLEDLVFCENLSAHSLAYLHEHPSLERLTETVQRIEETVDDQFEEPVVPQGAVVEIGPAIDRTEAEREAEVGRGREDPFIERLAEAIQGLLNKLRAQGPPEAWHCPRAAEPAEPTVAAISPGM
jgi:1-acyl-sn-glycerol-3-phosphate acyltransferase